MNRMTEPALYIQLVGRSEARQADGEGVCK